MLTEIIPKIAGMDSQKEDKRRNNIGYRHRCSGATYGEKCVRQQVLHASGVKPKSFPDRFSLVLDDSSWHEHLTADWIRKSGYKLHSEQMKVTPFMINGAVVTGSIDGILTDMQANDIHYEHKAINHFTFEKYEKGKVYPYDYIAQCICYIIGIKKEVGKMLPSLLLIKNKNTSRYMEYLIEYDDQEDIAKVKLSAMDYTGNELGALVEIKEFFMEEVQKRIVERFKDIDKYVADKTIPKRQYLIDSWRCEYCRWAGVCWENYDAEVLERKEGVTLDDKHCAKVIEYKELGDKGSEIKKKRDNLKDELKKEMALKEAKTAVGGGYVLNLGWKEGKEYTVKAKRYEDLSIRKVKEKKK